MFPRIIKHQRYGKKYEYLVISRSVYKNGKSTTEDIIKFGNIEKIKHNDIINLINGLIRIFQLDGYFTKNRDEIPKASC